MRQPEGICGSGLVDLLAELRRAAWMSSRGAFADKAAEVRVVEEPRITLSRSDVGHLAIAKAATAVGQRVLLRRLGLRPRDLDNVYLAGGFANALDVESAIDIGLLVPGPARADRPGRERVHRRRPRAAPVAAPTGITGRARPPDRARGARIRARLLRPVHRRLPVRADHSLRIAMSPARSRRTDPDQPAADPAADGWPRRPRTPATGPGALRRALARPPALRHRRGAGPVGGRCWATPAGQKPLKMAADLAGDPRITALSVTDNAGGHARLSPERARGGAAGARATTSSSTSPAGTGTGTRSRASAGTCCRAGLTTILAISGDYPVEGYSGAGEARVRRGLGRAAGAATGSSATPRWPRRPRTADGTPRRHHSLLPRLRRGPVQAPRAGPRPAVPQARA